MIQRAKLISHTNAGIVLSHLFLSGVVESITKQSRKSTARRVYARFVPDQWHPSHRGSQTVYDHIAAIATMNATTAMKGAASKSDISHMVRSHCIAPFPSPHPTPRHQHADRRLDGINHLETMAGPLHVIGDLLLIRRQPSARWNAQRPSAWKIWKSGQPRRVPMRLMRISNHATHATPPAR